MGLPDDFSPARFDAIHGTDDVEPSRDQERAFNLLVSALDLIKMLRENLVAACECDWDVTDALEECDGGLDEIVAAIGAAKSATGME